MKVTLHSTTKVVHLNGVPARIWEGETESGIPVHAYVTRIAVHEDQDLTEFQRELQEHEPPSADIAAIPVRLII